MSATDEGRQIAATLRKWARAATSTEAQRAMLRAADMIAPTTAATENQAATPRTSAGYPGHTATGR